MKILILGNLGYVGRALTDHLIKFYPSYELIGVDANWFPVNDTPDNSSHKQLKQIFKDIRSLDLVDFDGIDAVIALAAVSNDPIGKMFASATRDINVTATQKAAKLAGMSGVKRFVFASSCSVYGFGGDVEVNETGSINPLTEYALSKAKVEKFLMNENLGSMTSVALRFGTACGYSKNMRLDLVLNDFVYSGLSSCKIDILSNGKPWRPLVHVNDMAKALAAAISTNSNSQCDVYNVGRVGDNWTVLELAEAVQQQIKNLKIDINQDAKHDDRSYRVDFSKFSSHFGKNFLEYNLESMIDDMIVNLKREKDLKLTTLHPIRLNRLSELIKIGHLNSSLIKI